MKATTMKNVLMVVGVMSCGLAIAAVGWAQKDAPASAPKAASRAVSSVPAPGNANVEVTADEKAVYQLINEFEKAFNSQDAKALAALFTEDAELVNEEGEVAHGRAEIEARFAASFSARPDAKLTTHVDSIRSIGTGVVVEDGTTTVTLGSDAPAERSRYTAIHSKQDGKWKMASAREFSATPLTNAERLQELEWLIGEWVDESPDSVVTSSFKWSPDGNFILNEYSAKIAGRQAVSGTQRLGWDALNQQIHSWMFDSNGGFGEGLWSRDGDRWVIKDRRINKCRNHCSHARLERGRFASGHPRSWRAWLRHLLMCRS